MSSTDPGRETTSHVDRATIDVSQAEIVQGPQSRQQAKYLAYAGIVLFLFMTGIGLANLLFTSSNVQQVRANSALIQVQVQLNQEIIAKQQRQIRASCNFYADLAGLPLANGPDGKPSELGVKIISDSRGAWDGLGCPGTLAPPSASYVRGAALYRLPVN